MKEKYRRSQKEQMMNKKSVKQLKFVDKLNSSLQNSLEFCDEILSHRQNLSEVGNFLKLDPKGSSFLV